MKIFQISDEWSEVLGALIKSLVGCRLISVFKLSSPHGDGAVEVEVFIPAKKVAWVLAQDRLLEVLRLRIKDAAFSHCQILARDARVLRHSVATDLLERGQDIPEARSCSGTWLCRPR